MTRFKKIPLTFSSLILVLCFLSFPKSAAADTSGSAVASGGNISAEIITKVNTVSSSVSLAQDSSVRNTPYVATDPTVFVNVAIQGSDSASSFSCGESLVSALANFCGTHKPQNPVNTSPFTFNFSWSNGSNFIGQVLGTIVGRVFPESLILLSFSLVIYFIFSYSLWYLRLSSGTSPPTFNQLTN